MLEKEIENILNNTQNIAEKDLYSLYDALVLEMKTRSMSGNDPHSAVEYGFEYGFEKNSKPKTPFIHEGMLVCPGFKEENSKTSHNCVFVSVDKTWTWEHPYLLADDYKTGVNKTKPIKKFVSVLALWEGMVFEVVESSARSGPCKMQKVTQYTIKNNQIVKTGARTGGGNSSGEGR